MLNPNAEKWVAALRSGEYQQGKNYLHIQTYDGTHKYCCLGVACEIYVKEGNHLNIARHKTNPQNTDFEYSFSYGGLDGVLPDEVCNWLGLKYSQGAYSFETSIPNEALSKDNDEKDKTFEQIADILESEPTGLFKSE